MNRTIWLRYGVIALGLGAVFSLLWYAAPFLPVGNSHPFDNPATRLAAIGIAALSGGIYVVYDLQSRLNSTKQLALGMVPETAPGAPPPIDDDRATLQTRMSEALTILKKASGAKGDYLYDLPWYVLIGPPGSGKTTALVHSGLKFPLNRGGVPAAIAGEGGTRYCDWWFTEEAVMIDTAGRYTTQDSNRQADQGSWLSFLGLLSRYRPKQPINGVLVCISIEDILTLPADALRAHADAIRARLMELHDRLKVDFPVYAVFSKADLISGFMECFGSLNQEGRQVVWGTTFQTDDKNANLVDRVPAEFDLLIERLNQDLLDRLQEEPTPTGRVQILGFPSQVAALKDPVFRFLNAVFEPTRYRSNATLRGFYLTSGTQNGTPIDQLVGALARGFGTQDMGSVRYSGQGKSFFLADLLQKVVFNEAGWVSTNIRAVRRSALLKTAGYAMLALLCIGLGGAWWGSYGRNTALIGDSYAAITRYKSATGALRDETGISDADFRLVEPALRQLRDMPAGFTARGEPVPLQATFGLDQKPRLNVSAEQAYEMGLQRLLRPRMMVRLEQVMRHQAANTGFLSGALNIYLMIAGTEPVDRHLALEWWRRDFETLYPGAANAAGRKSLLDHVSRLLDLDGPEGTLAAGSDNDLVQTVRHAIGRMSVADRAFDLMRTNASKESARDWVFKNNGGQDVALIFEGVNGADLDAVRVPFFYTYAGFQQAFMQQLALIGAQVRQERGVLGDVADQTALKTQYDQLPQALYERYSREFKAAWQTELRKVRIRLLTADKPRYLALQAAASPTSPITRIVESIREETALTKERADKGALKPSSPETRDKGTIPLNPFGSEVPGASIEQEFRGYALLVEGDRTRRPVDDLMSHFNDVYQALTLLNDPVRSAEGRQKFADGLRTLQATAGRFPEPFKAMVQNAALSFDNDATGTTIARLQQSLSEQVTSVCQQIVSGAYPFARGSSRDLSVQDLQKLFGPNGVMDRYFTTNLAQYANTSGANWAWIQASPVARQLPPGMLQSFQRAAEIRQAFFPNGAPGFSFSVKNLAIGADVDMARFEMSGAPLVTERPPPPTPSLFGGAGSPPPVAQPPLPAPAMVFQWPGPVGMEGAAIATRPELPMRANMLQKPGIWGIFRLLDAVSVTLSGPALIVRVTVGAREVQYQINTLTNPNAFTVPALRSFTCPSAR